MGSIINVWVQKNKTYKKRTVEKAVEKAGSLKETACFA